MEPQNRTITGWMHGVIALMLAALPFHAFLTVWVSSLVGHYTLLRLWKEGLLALLAASAVGLCIKSRRGRREPLLLLVAVYVGLLLLIGAVALLFHQVGSKALAYGLLLDLRFLLFFVVVWLVASRSGWLRHHWRPLLLWPALAVVLFAVVQYLILPADFLRHFGYGPATILPQETIDHKSAYLRVQSALRGANPLGAYLVLIVSACAVLVARDKKRRKLYLAGLVLTLAALAFSFSRSAWIGAVLSLAAVAWLSLRSLRARRWLAAGAVSILLVMSGAVLGLRHNDYVQNTLFHSDEHSRSASSSNAGHVSALKNGLHDVAHQPLGRGPGTAGPASVYNVRPARIAENYYLQLGQEVGVIGLGLFIAINVLVAIKLRRRSDSLSLILLVSLVGISFVNLLSHAWTDDTLSYVWWGLAGVALGCKSSQEPAVTTQ